MPQARGFRTEKIQYIKYLHCQQTRVHSLAGSFACPHPTLANPSPVPSFSMEKPPPTTPLNGSEPDPKPLPQRHQ